MTRCEKSHLYMSVLLLNCSVWFPYVASGKNRSLGNITAEVMDDYANILDEIDAVTYYNFRQVSQ